MALDEMLDRVGAEDRPRTLGNAEMDASAIRAGAMKSELAKMSNHESQAPGRQVTGIALSATPASPAAPP